MVCFSLRSMAAALALLALHAPSVLSLPQGAGPSRITPANPPIKVIDTDFADPSFLLVNGTYYAYATSGMGKVIQTATSPDFFNWTLQGDAMPQHPLWGTSSGVWAPDVIERADGGFVMYFAAQPKTTKDYCIGVATSSSPLGPFTATSAPLACPTSQGGAIDPSGYLENGTHYVVYKVDGNSLGNNSPTPIMLQKLDDTATVPVGSPIVILQHSASDGPLVEAPSLAKGKDLYYLFFSSNMYNTPNYDISYAASTKLEGPYTKTGIPFALTGDVPGIVAPGGATVSPDLGKMVHHAFANGKDISDGRAMFAIDLGSITLSRCGH